MLVLDAGDSLAAFDLALDFCGAGETATPVALDVRGRGLPRYTFSLYRYFRAGKSLFQQFAVISQIPSRRQTCTNFPRSAIVVPFAC